MTKVADTRVQIDISHLPNGVVPRLRELAEEKGLRLAMYCRTVLVEHALKSEKR